MRLACVDSARTDTLGGIERLLVDLSRRAMDAGHQAIVVARPGSLLAGHARSHGVPVLTLPLRSDLDPASIFGLRRMFSSQGTEVVLGTLHRDARLAGLARFPRRRPRIVLLKGLPMMKPGFRHAWTYRHCVDAILSPTQWLAGEVKAYDYVRGIPLEVIPDGIAEELFPALPALADARVQARTERGIPATRSIFLSVGHLVMRKNFGAVVAWLLALPGNTDWEWWIAGDGPQESMLRAGVAEAGLTGRVHFLGRVEDIPSRMLCADLVLVPSLEEQFPLVALEARRAGVPRVLVAPVGAQAEMQQLGVRIVALEDAVGWVGGMCEACEHPGASDVPSSWSHSAVRSVEQRLAFLGRVARGQAG